MNGRWNVAFEQLNTMSVTSPAESLSILVVDDFVPFRRPYANSLTISSL